MADYYVKLKDGNNYIFPEMYGVDTNNILAGTVGVPESAWSQITPYTATQDCYVCGGSWNVNLTIDNTVIMPWNDASGAWGRFCIFLKKGQTFEGVSGYSAVFGLKK